MDKSVEQFVASAMSTASDCEYAMVERERGSAPGANGGGTRVLSMELVLVCGVWTTGGDRVCAPTVGEPLLEICRHQGIEKKLFLLLLLSEGFSVSTVVWAGIGSRDLTYSAILAHTSAHHLSVRTAYNFKRA